MSSNIDWYGELLAPLYAARDWRWGFVDGDRVPTASEISDCIRSLMAEATWDRTISTGGLTVHGPSDDDPALILSVEIGELE